MPGMPARGSDLPLTGLVSEDSRLHRGCQSVSAAGSKVPRDHGEGSDQRCWLLQIFSTCGQSLSRVRLFATLWTVARQAPLSMGFPRQEYWSGLSFPSPGDLPNPGIEPSSPALQADSLLSEPPGKPVCQVGAPSDPSSCDSRASAQAFALSCSCFKLQKDFSSFIYSSLIRILVSSYTKM